MTPWATIPINEALIPSSVRVATLADYEAHVPHRREGDQPFHVVGEDASDP